MAKMYVISDNHFYGREYLRPRFRQMHKHDVFGRKELEKECIDDVYHNANDDNEKINSWNKEVTSNSDIVWILGDFVKTYHAFYWDVYRHFWHKLNGKKILILGNHELELISKDYDPASEPIICGINPVFANPLIINDILLLSHKPYDVINNKYVNLHGHFHKIYNGGRFRNENYIPQDKSPFYYNCCLDYNDNKPILLSNIIDNIISKAKKKRKFKHDERIEAIKNCLLELEKENMTVTKAKILIENNRVIKEIEVIK